MAMVRWRPFGEIDKFLEEMHMTNHAARELATDVYEKNGNVIVEMNVAGIEPDKVDISVEGDHLRVSGERKEEKEEKERDYYVKEIRQGSFERIIHLPTQVDREKTKASVENGILKITLPRKTKESGHKVKVEKH